MTTKPKTKPTKLWRWRAAHNLTLADVAGLTGVSEAMISLSERIDPATGRPFRRLAPLTRVRFARALGVPVAELFDPEIEDDVADP